MAEPTDERSGEDPMTEGEFRAAITEGALAAYLYNKMDDGDLPFHVKMVGGGPTRYMLLIRMINSTRWVRVRIEPFDDEVDDERRQLDTMLADPGEDD